MVLSIIVAVADGGVIGKDGKMPWHLPDESAYFYRTTIGHPVITGRKNFEAMGRPLPGRLNVIITRQPDYQAPEGCVVAHSLKSALELPKVKNEDEIFVIGGQQIYEQAMPLANKLYLTFVDAKMDGDTFFKYDSSQWHEIRSQEHPADDKHKYSFRMTVQERIKK